jgi:hypothetical protein
MYACVENIHDPGAVHDAVSSPSPNSPEAKPAEPQPADHHAAVPTSTNPQSVEPQTTLSGLARWFGFA